MYLFHTRNEALINTTKALQSHKHKKTLYWHMGICAMEEYIQNILYFYFIIF